MKKGMNYMVDHLANKVVVTRKFFEASIVHVVDDFGKVLFVKIGLLSHLAFFIPFSFFFASLFPKNSRPGVSASPLIQQY